jgi:glucose-6-phosphate isomerase
MASLKNTPAWKALQVHARETAKADMRTLFARDRKRFKRFSLAQGGLFLDYSKNRITAETMRLLTALAREADVAGWRRRMAKGETVNQSEGRAALHMALRANKGDGVGTKETLARVLRERARLKRFADDVHAGKRAGATGERFRAAVVLGIGGSHRGPAMAVEALRPYRRPDFEVRFAANVDGAALARSLEDLDPETTLVIVSSKTFTTEETMANARAARAWLAKSLGDKQALAHFAAVSADNAAVDRFGIACDDTFQIWDWVGGRFSLTSAVGLPVALALSSKSFEALLAGARAMDRHFLTAPLAKNMPVVLALIDVWNSDFMGCSARAVVPYDEGLALFPAYVRQLEMESNGKPGGRGAAPVVFGEAGTGAQHEFFQALHQGPDAVPCDFIAARECHDRIGDHHQRLLANMLAQAESLMLGRDAKDKARAFPGNRPSNVILLDALDPFSLGQLVALHEHKTFVEGVLWGLNPFDQWGVELGKELAAAILPELKGKPAKARHDGSTAGLIHRLRKKKNARRP